MADELSALSHGIAELVEPASIEVSAADAAKLQVIEGDGLAIADGEVRLEVRINNNIAGGCAAFSAGLDGTFDLAAGQ